MTISKESLNQPDLVSTGDGTGLVVADQPAHCYRFVQTAVEVITRTERRPTYREADKAEVIADASVFSVTMCNVPARDR